MRTRHTLYFLAPYHVELREEPLPELAAREVLVETICSAISAGSEMLLYRGQFPSVRDPHDRLSSGLTYPAPYGYACVGRVIDVGPQVEESLIGRLVFVFHPHSTHFAASLDHLHLLPADVSAEAACFLANTETAITLVHDAAPLLGERALVLGQGIVGLLTTALLAEFPLQTLLTADKYPLRRQLSLALGAADSLDPGRSDFRALALDRLGRAGADFSIEISGAPSALNDAIALTRFGGRIIIGSWYGAQQATLDLGGAFHRSRICLYASQVSTIRPELSARWDKARRLALAWDALRRIRPERWITHRIPIQQAPEAYRLIDQAPEAVLQVLLVYP